MLNVNTPNKAHEKEQNIDSLVICDLDGGKYEKAIMFSVNLYDDVNQWMY